MKVKDVGRVDILNLTDAKKRNRATAPAEDRVSVGEDSEVGKAVTAARSAAASTRSSELEALATAVRQGTYKPDPKKIAEQILQDAELIARLQSLLK